MARLNYMVAYWTFVVNCSKCLFGPLFRSRCLKFILFVYNQLSKEKSSKEVKKTLLVKICCPSGN